MQTSKRLKRLEKQRRAASAELPRITLLEVRHLDHTGRVIATELHDLTRRAAP